MATSNKQLLVLEFTLVTSPTGAFSLTVPNEKPINKGYFDVKSPQTRIYNFNAKKNAFTITENGQTQTLQEKERKKVQNIVEDLVRGVYLAEMQVVGHVMRAGDELAMEKSPLGRLELALGIWSDCLGGQGGR